IDTAKTSSGLTVVTARRPGVSAVAWLGFRGGYADATPPLLVELALRTRPDARRAPTLQMLPARGATRDLSFDTIEFRPARLNEALALLFAKATTMVSDWPARDDLARLLAPVAAAEVADQKKADGAFWRALFGNHRDARLVSTADLDGVTRSDVDAWIGRVHNVRNAALVVVGDVDPALVKRAAEVLSKENGRPAWVAEISTPRPPPVRPAGAERVVAVVTPRATTLIDLRVGCLLPTMTTASRAADELLASAMEARLNDAIRIEQGDGYGVNVSVQRLRDGATYLGLSTFVPEQSLTRTLSVLHSHWRRWGQGGFDASEVNVGRWRGAGAYAAAVSNPNALAMELLDRWSADPAAVGSAPLRPDLAGTGASRLNELFATCRANTVLGLTGDEAHIQRALDQSWPTVAKP
ncbi:MAG: insulinase family protein, partial [Verrucomicrobiota bacterium]